MEETEKEKEVIVTPKPKKVTPKLAYIANNNTFVIEADTEKKVAVEVNGEEWDEAQALEGIATVVLKHDLPETYTYKLKIK